MTIEQYAGIWLLIVVAILLLYVLPPSSPYHRVMLSGWGVRPREKYGRLRRSDFLRYVPVTIVLGVTLLAVSVLVGGYAEENRASLGGGALWVNGVMFGAFLLAGMCALGSLELIWRALRWEPEPTLPFLVYAGEDVIGETALEEDSHLYGRVGGGLRPFPEFEKIEALLRELATSLLSLDPDRIEAELRAFGREQRFSVRAMSGAVVRAIDVAVLDLRALKVGVGYWVVVTLQDTNEWRERFSSDSRRRLRAEAEREGGSGPIRTRE